MYIQSLTSRDHAHEWSWWSHIPLWWNNLESLTWSDSLCYPFGLWGCKKAQPNRTFLGKQISFVFCRSTTGKGMISEILWAPRDSLLLLTLSEWKQNKSFKSLFNWMVRRSVPAPSPQPCLAQDRWLFRDSCGTGLKKWIPGTAAALWGWGKGKFLSAPSSHVHFWDCTFVWEILMLLLRFPGSCRLG